jgi:hypothetical protein
MPGANQTAIGRAGGVERLMAVLSLHISNFRVMEQACAALWNVAINGVQPLAASPAFSHCGLPCARRREQAGDHACGRRGTAAYGASEA